MLRLHFILRLLPVPLLISGACSLATAGEAEPPKCELCKAPSRGAQLLARRSTTATSSVMAAVANKEPAATVAEPADDMLVPAALVFIGPPGAVSLGNVTSWWHWTPIASWRAPDGPGAKSYLPLKLPSRETQP